MNNIISSKAVNTARQVELDIVKGIAIITMIICHTVGIMGEIPDHVGYIVSEEILGGPMAAPMFMLCMGIGINFSRRNTPLTLFRRGASIFLLSYILNFTRSALPIVLGFLIGGAELVSFDMLVMGLMIVDILQFAGLALMFLGVCLKLRLKDWQLLSIAVICSVLGSLSAYFSSGNLAIDSIVGLFIGAGPDNYDDCVSAFPFLHWILFPLFGYVAGKRLIRCADKERLYLRVLAVTLPLTVFYFWVVSQKGWNPFSKGFYYWPSIVDSFFFLCLDLCLISIAWQLIKILPHKVTDALQSLSSRITTVYFISWVIICWIGIPLFWGLEIEPLNPWLAYIPGVLIIVVSYRLAIWWSNQRKKWSL